MIAPPYGTPHAPWEVSIDFESLFAELWRLLKPNGALLLFAQMTLATRLARMQPKTFRYQWVREKPHAASLLNANRMQPKRQTLQKRRRQNKDNPHLPHDNHKRLRLDRRRPLPQRRHQIQHGQNTLGHPTQKPEALMQYMIRQYTQLGELVLPPLQAPARPLRQPKRQDAAP